MSTSLLRAGAARVDITPPLGTQIAGDIGRLRPVEEVREPTYANVLALDRDGQVVVIISCDLGLIEHEYTGIIRGKIRERFGLPAAQVLIHSTQSHAAPAVGPFMISPRIPLPDDLWFIRGDDPRYNPIAVEGILTAVGEALDARQPVMAKAGRWCDGRVAFNRRFVMRDGTGRTHPWPMGDPNILYCEGPIDPEVALLVLENAAGQAVAALLHHTCHPVHGYPERWASSGWPGAWVEGVRGLLGTQCVPLIINGLCGNIHHTNHLDPNFVDDYHEIGRKLTETAARILANLRPVEGDALAWVTKTVEIPYRVIDDEQIAKDDAFLAAHPEPVWMDRDAGAIEWEWIYAHARKDLRLRKAESPTYAYEIQAFRLGDIVILGMEGEPFVEAQLDIKLASPAAFTLVAHMANGCAGYVPTRRAFANGGYETRPGTWSALEYGALETITAEAIEVIRTLFSE
jgi:hypothetical protein